LRLLLFSELYPKASNESAGTFITQRLVVLRNTGVDYKCVVLEFRDTLWLKIARKVLRNRESYSGRPVSIDQKAVYPYSLYEYHCLKKGVSDLTFKHVWEKRLLKFLKSIIEEKPDLIHAHWVYPNGFLAVKLGEILHIPVVVTAHGSDIHTNPYKNKRILNQTIYSLENADKVIFVSEALKRSAISFGYSGSNSVIVPNGIDLNAFGVSQELILKRNANTEEKREYVVGFVGSLLPVKRADKLPVIFKKIADSVDARFIIVGDGPLREKIQRECSILGINVQFAGQAQPKEVVFFIRQMDALVLPSRKEGFGCVIIEAQACGVPVVGSDQGGIPEAVGDGGVIVSDGKDFEERFAAETVRILHSSFDPERLRTRALEYSWDNIVHKEILVYEECLSKK